MFNKVPQMLFVPNGAVSSKDAASNDQKLSSFEDHSAQEKRHFTIDDVTPGVQTALFDENALPDGRVP